MPCLEYDVGNNDKESFVEVDPTRRYGFYDKVVGRGAMKKVC
jgi:hypothetical protein